MQKVILDLCGGTGAWSKPYREAGYDVIVLDLDHPDPAAGIPFGDITLLEKLPFEVHGILAAPPCTMFAVSGNRWRAIEKKKGIYEQKLAQALKVVDACLRLVYVYKPAWWAIENPVGILHRFLGPPVMTFQPYEYGDPYSKKTCLWGDFNFPKKRVVVPTRGSIITNKYCGKDKIKRSITPPRFAKAFFEANV